MNDNIIEILEGALDFQPTSSALLGGTTLEEKIFLTWVRTKPGNEQVLVDRARTAWKGGESCYLKTRSANIPLQLSPAISSIVLPEHIFIPIVLIAVGEMEDEYGVHQAVHVGVNLSIVLADLKS